MQLYEIKEYLQKQYLDFKNSVEADLAKLKQKAVSDSNELLVNASSGEAVSAAQKKQKEAEKKIRITESRMKTEQEKAKAEIKRIKKELEKQNKKMKEKEFLWGLGYVILILLTVIMK